MRNTRRFQLRSRVSTSVPGPGLPQPGKVALVLFGLCCLGHAVSLSLSWTKQCDDNGMLGSCESVSFSPDGQLLGTTSRFSKTIKGSGKNRVKMWNAGNGGSLWKGDHDFQAKYGAFSPDGKVFVSVGDDKKAKVWNAKTGSLLKTIDIGGTSDGVTFSRSGEILAVASGSAVKLYKTDDWSFIKTIPHNDGGELNGIDFSPGDHYMASCAKGLKIWKMPEGTLVKTLPHASSIKSTAISQDGKYVASCDGEGITKAWSLPDGKLLATFNPFHSNAKVSAVMDWPAYTESVRFSPDGKFLATGSHDRRIRFYSVGDWKTNYEFNTQPGKPEKDWANQTGGKLNVEDIDFSKDGKFLAAASEDGNVRVYKLSGVGPGSAPSTPLIDYIPRNQSGLEFKMRRTRNAWSFTTHDMETFNLNGRFLIREKL